MQAPWKTICAPPEKGRCHWRPSWHAFLAGSLAIRSQHKNDQSFAAGQAPSGPDAAVVTGSEDGTLRRMTIDLQQPVQPLLDSQQIGEHPAGSVVKALACIPWGPGTHRLPSLLSLKAAGPMIMSNSSKRPSA